MAIEYITSKNLFLLICNTLKLMNPSLVKHGKRVSYIMSKMLECKGGYEKFEIADFMLLGVLHDIGAYKTDDVRKPLSYEAKNPLPHSIYGYLFLKYLSPLTEQSKMILYHHIDTSKMRTLDYKYLEETEILKIAEIMDVWLKAFGDKFNYKLIEKYSGTKFSANGIRLLYATVEKYDIFAKIVDGRFEQEFEESMDYVLLSDEEKDKYLRMLMYCTGLKYEGLVANTIATICVSRELATKMQISEMDKNEIYYAALLHDIGMLTIPKSLLDAPRKLKEEEINLIRTHVASSVEAIEGKLSKSITEIVEVHHERFDGSGYPKGLKGGSMSEKQAILQISESVVNMNTDKPYRKAFSKEEIVEDINMGIINGKYEGVVADTLLKNYDDIMTKATEKAKSAMVTHQKLKRNSEQVYRNFT